MGGESLHVLLWACLNVIISDLALSLIACNNDLVFIRHYMSWVIFVPQKMPTGTIRVYLAVVKLNLELGNC